MPPITNIFIFGSCVSRDIFRIHPHNVTVANYFTRSSFASAFHSTYINDRWSHNLESNFQRRMVQGDLKKRCSQALSQTQYDIVLVDFIDERFKLARFANGGIATFSSEMRRAGLDVRKDVVGLITAGTEEHFALWQKGWQSFIDTMKQLDKLECIRINKIFWGSEFEDGSKPDWDITPETVDKMNVYLQRLYTRVAWDIPAEQILSFSHSDFTLNADHQWGVSPFHYANAYYTKAASMLTQPIAAQAIDSALSCFMQASLEKHCANAVTLQNGTLLVTENTVQLGLFPPIPLDIDALWDTNPLEHRSWAWWVHQLTFLPQLIAYHHASKQETALELGVKLFEAWTKRYLHLENKSPLLPSWRDHGAALRAENIALFLYYVQYHASAWLAQHPKLMQELYEALEIHAQCLLEESFYSRHTNHGVEQCRVLLTLAALFPQAPNSKTWQETAIERLCSELAFAFTEEGVHAENSPSYHLFVLRIFTDMVLSLPPHLTGAFSEALRHIAPSALEFYTRILRPDGCTPNIGDSNLGRTSADYLESFRRYFGQSAVYQHFQYAHTQGRQGTALPGLNKVYAKSGYALFRNGWVTPKNQKQALHLLVKAGCLSQYHHQQDEGNIVLYAFGEDWLIDSGHYCYKEQDFVRKYIRSRRAHNVALVSNTSYAPEFSHRMQNWAITSYDESPDEPHVAMDLCVLLNTRQTRRVSYNKSTATILVTDTFTMLDAVPRDIVLLWHTPIDKTITVHDNSSATITSASGTVLKLTTLQAAPDAITVGKGIRGDKVISCTSLRPNKYHDSQVIQVQFKQRSSLSVVSEFVFTQ